MAVSTSDFKNGLKINIDGSPYVIIYFQHVKPGKGGAFVRTKIKNLLNGKTVDKTFRAGEKVTEAEIEERVMQYLYNDGSDCIFMDSKNFDQIPITDEVIGDNSKFLLENAEVGVLFYKGNPVNIDLPSFVELVISQSDPGVKGDTSSGATKPATLETGAVIQVPLFLKEGEKVRVDTRTGEYVERVN
ncbi:MAG TPA: elongation factor P [Myxococcales bacterium]|nr:elongation factor P [Myxococcales bacterium]HIM02444.1 elongation factor P [Myxococcales bacterium]